MLKLLRRIQCLILGHGDMWQTDEDVTVTTMSGYAVPGVVQYSTCMRCGSETMEVTA